MAGVIGELRIYLNRHHFLFVILIFVAKYFQNVDLQMAADRLTTKICVQQVDKSSLRARHKSCFLRPDTGPCRADIIQYYFDAMQTNCYRFFWGGCQGNGNKFESRRDCMNHCFINSSAAMKIPFFCSLSFDFGTCFGHYNRWAWDKYSKTCRRRLYSGCGGNQNNFESRKECMSTCLNPPNNTLFRFHKYTTCIPFTIEDLH